MKRVFLFASAVATALFVGCAGENKDSQDEVVAPVEKPEVIEVNSVAPEPELLVCYKLPEASEPQLFKNKKDLTDIHIGTLPYHKPSKKGKKLDDRHYIQLGDTIKNIEDIAPFVLAEHKKVTEIGREVCLKVDREAKMGLIDDVKQELRRDGVVSKIYYATKFAVETSDEEFGFITEVDPSEEALRYKREDDELEGVVLLQSYERYRSSNTYVEGRNLLRVHISKTGEIVAEVGNEPMSEVLSLEDEVEEFILNKSDDPNLPEKVVAKITMPNGSIWKCPVSQAVILLSYDRETPYDRFIGALNGLVAVVNGMRDNLAQDKFGKCYYDLTAAEKSAILKAVPYSYYDALRPVCKQVPPQRTEIKVFSDVLEIVTNEEKVDPDINFDEFIDIEDVVFIPQVAAVEEETVEDDRPFVKVEQMPSFQGGDLMTFRNWVFSKLRYPQIAQENGITGRVLLSFVIEKDGSLTNIQVLQTPDQSLSDEAIRVFKTAPKWKPGKQGDKVVRVKYTVPIDFRIQN